MDWNYHCLINTCNKPIQRGPDWNRRVWNPSMNLIPKRKWNRTILIKFNITYDLISTCFRVWPSIRTWAALSEVPWVFVAAHWYIPSCFSLLAFLIVKMFRLIWKQWLYTGKIFTWGTSTSTCVGGWVDGCVCVCMRKENTNIPVTLSAKPAYMFSEG